MRLLPEQIGFAQVEEMLRMSEGGLLRRGPPEGALEVETQVGVFAVQDRERRRISRKVRLISKIVKLLSIKYQKFSFDIFFNPNLVYFKYIRNS